MRAIVPLSDHPNANESVLVAVWQDPTTDDAVWLAGAGFIATIGRTGAAFVDLFETQAAAVAALIRHRAPAFSPLSE
jgi:hypothetical protein